MGNVGMSTRFFARERALCWTHDVDERSRPAPTSDTMHPEHICAAFLEVGQLSFSWCWCCCKQSCAPSTMRRETEVEGEGEGGRRTWRVRLGGHSARTLRHTATACTLPRGCLTLVCRPQSHSLSAHQTAKTRSWRRVWMFPPPPSTPRGAHRSHGAPRGRAAHRQLCCIRI